MYGCDSDDEGSRIPGQKVAMTVEDEEELEAKFNEDR